MINVANFCVAGGNGGGGSHVSNAQDDGGWGASAGALTISAN